MTIIPEKKDHLPYLDGLRGCAAIYVVIHHATLRYRPADASALTNALLNFFAYGRYAVDVFIVLSGFCLMIPVVKHNYELRGGTLLFYKKRARRILPPYFLVMGWSLLLIVFLIHQKTGSMWDSSLPITAKGLITHALLVQDLFNDTANQIDYVLWSVSVEWRIYFLFPLLLLCCRRMGIVAATLISIGGAALLTILTYALSRGFPSLDISMRSSPHYLALFGFGMFAGDLALGGRKASWRAAVPWNLLLTGLTAFLVVASVTTFHGHGVPWLAFDLLVGAWAACMLVVAAGKPEERHLYRPLIRLLSWSPLVFAGTFAYSIYLVHAPLLQLILQYGVAPLQRSPAAGELLLTCVGVPIVIAASYVFFRFCEEPFLNRRPPQNRQQSEVGAVLQPAT